MINKSIKFFTIFLLAFNVFAGGDDRDQEYYEALDEELAAFEAQLAEDLANQAALDAFAAELANQTALDEFQANLEAEKAAAAASTAAYQSKLEYDAKVEELMEALAIEQELNAFEDQLAAELAAAEMMAEMIAEEELAKRLAEFQANLEAEKAAAARSTAIYQARQQQEQMIKDRQAQLALERELNAFEDQLAAELAAELAAAEMMAEIEEEMARQAAEKAAAEAAAEAAAAEAAAAAAVQAAAEAAAAPQLSITGSASVSYDDNGSSASSTTYDADLTFTGSVGTVGGSITTVTIGADVDADWSQTSADLSSTIGPLTIAADMFDEDESNVDDGDGDIKTDVDNRSVTVSLDAPIGDATVGLSDGGDVTISGTFSGVTVTHTIKDGDDKTVASASIAGMDISLTNDAGSTTWSIGTTVSGVDLTLDSENDVTAAFGLAGNTLTVTHVGERAAVAEDATNYSTASADAYTTAAVSRDLTSGATLTATYSSSDDSLTLKAAVTF